MAKRCTRRTDGISYRNFDGAWYSSAGGEYKPLRDEAGKKIKGKDQEQAARSAYARLLLLVEASGGPVATKPTAAATVRDVCNLYLEKIKSQSPTSAPMTARYLKLFAVAVGPDTKAASLGRFTLTNHLLNHPNWGPATRNRCIATIVTAYNWAIERGAVEVNPFKGFKRDKVAGRVTLISDAQEQIIFRYAAPEFAELISFLLATGCRPDEASRIEAHHCTDTGEAVVVTLKDWKNSKKTGRPRIIYVVNGAATKLRALILARPRGPLFVAAGKKPSDKQPWTSAKRDWAWRNLRAKILRNLKKIAKKEKRDFDPAQFPAEISLYSCRHSSITRLLLKGVSVAAVAELHGTSAEMISQVYGHLNLCRNHLLEAAKLAM